MRWLTSLLLIFYLTVNAFSSDQIPSTPAVPCSDNATKTATCNISKKDLKDAKTAFSRALKLEHSNRLEEAFAEFEQAARLAPQDMQFLTAREMARQQLVYEYLQRGNTSMLKGRSGEALGEFRSAINLDPQNEFAQQRLRDALGSSAPKVSAPQVVANTAEIELAPLQRRADFHYRGDARGLISEIGATFGIAVTFDDSVAARRVRFDIENVDFYTAMQAASAVTKSFWTPIDEKQILVAANTLDNHRVFDRMMLRTFYVPGASTPQELNDVTNVLRSLFDIRFVMQQSQSSTITVRAPQNALNAATQFMENLDSARPQVLLDVHAYEVSRTFMRNIGMHIPYQFRLFNIPAAALAALGGQNIQDLINQLIASGGINQANTTALSALLAQLQSQQNSIFSQPLATFGGGLTFFGLSLDQLNATLSVNENSIKTLEHATLRASEGKDATFHVGTRFPILNASFAPIFNTPAIAQNIQNNTFQAAFPSFNYEDLGLNIKANPDIHGNSDVSLQLDLEIRALGGASLNGVPVISNRQYKGSITLKNGEPAVVAGSISRTEQRSLSGIPGLGQFPGLNKVMATNNKEEDDDELLIVITPHVVSAGEANPGSEIWMSAAQ